MAARKIDKDTSTAPPRGHHTAKLPEDGNEPADATAAATSQPKRSRGRPPKDPIKGPVSEAERAAAARAKRKQEREELTQRVQRLANSFAASLLYLADADPVAARWIVTPLAPTPESTNLDALAATFHAAHFAWVQDQLVTAEERELFGRFVTAVADRSYSSDLALQNALAATWGYRREYELSLAKKTPAGTPTKRGRRTRG